MRSQIFAVGAALCVAVSTPAYAQHWGFQGTGRAMAGMGIVEYQSRDWAQCAGEEQAPPQRAISACGRIIGERDSRDATASALYFRSVLYRQSGDTTRADADVARAIELLQALIIAEPENPDHLHNLIFLRTETRDFAGAAADYERIAAQSPQSIEPRLHQAGFYFRAGDYRSAATTFDSAAQIDPASAQAQAGRCEARAAGNVQLDVAQQACAEALRLSGDSSPALFSRGFLRFRQGQVEEALADFAAAGEKDNTNSFAAYGYAVANLRLGRHEDRARALLANVTAAVPDVEMYAQAGMQP